ncbi:hypothetical protein MUP59_04245 [Candidatus Bathyarchaeota archaeon]|nr:hypothetical protein [Candidatus Bathyarchaeota archaeon]
MLPEYNWRRTKHDDDCILAAWGKSQIRWPPSVGDRVKVWWPEIRGKVAIVVATETEAGKGYKLIRKNTNMIRIKCGDVVVGVSMLEVFPREFTVKDIQKMDISDLLK